MEAHRKPETVQRAGSLNRLVVFLSLVHLAQSERIPFQNEENAKKYDEVFLDKLLGAFPGGNIASRSFRLGLDGQARFYHACG
jgi:hypothetical protein